jgi:cation diffusion facilitator CzcD-associated flavoprotein CzcO
VIGTGATGIQIIETIAALVEHLTVFQRTPQWIGPLRNSPVSDETQAEWKRTYPQIFEHCANTSKGFKHEPDPRRAMDVPKAERMALYEHCWQMPGFAKWLSIFHDVALDPVANAEYSDFIRAKIRATVHDPDVAAKLLPPRDLPFGARRVPLESGYYEAFNRGNVSLVDLRETPLERITKRGVKTSDTEHELDMIICATGFDANTGAMMRIDPRGEGGASLKEKWGTLGATTYLCLTTAGFPNFFTAVPRVAGNYPRVTELIVDWITNTIDYMRTRGLTRIVPTQEAEDAWVAHELSFSEGKLVGTHKSWMNGGNIPGKKFFPPYLNPLPSYRAELAAAAGRGYPGFEFDGGDGEDDRVERDTDFAAVFVNGAGAPVEDAEGVQV